jgi:glycosyl transferase, family 25
MKIYYINLAARPDRRQFMEDQFRVLGLDAERIEAVSKDEIGVEDRARFCNRDKPHYISEVELACSMSHEKAWRRLLAEGHAKALVLEDDAILSHSLPAALAALEARSDYGLVRLETTNRLSRVMPVHDNLIEGVTLREFRSTEYGAAAYVLDAATASLLINSPRLRDYQVDIALFCAFRQPGKSLHRAQADPALCAQLGSTDARTESLALSNINTVRDPGHRFAKAHPIRHRLNKLGYVFSVEFPKTWDHLLSLPRGLTRKQIPFRRD